MREYTSLSIITIIMLLFMACSDSVVNSEADDYLSRGANIGADSRAQVAAAAPGKNSIADIVVEAASTETDAEFTLLLAALEYAGLTSVFAGGGQYTVFAPNDEAFGNLVGAVADLLDPDVLANEGPFAAIDDLLGEGTVANVLLYHVTEGRRASNSVVPRNHRQDRKITTLLEGATFSVSSSLTITAVGNTSNIISANISASNGIIHVIDTVILPIDLGL